MNTEIRKISKSLTTQDEVREPKNNARNGEEEESNKVSAGPFPHRLSFNPHALSPPQRINFLQQIKFQPLLLQLLHALRQ